MPEPRWILSTCPDCRKQCAFLTSRENPLPYHKHVGCEKP